MGEIGMKQAPNTYTLCDLMKAADGTCTTELSDGSWVPARPLGFFSVSNRLRAAWLSFTGKGDVVVWPGDHQ